MSRQDRLRRLETLVQRVTSKIAALRDENQKLSVKLAGALREKESLEAELRKARSLHRRKDQLKTKVERAMKKIDKALELSES